MSPFWWQTAAVTTGTYVITTLFLLWLMPRDSVRGAARAYNPDEVLPPIPPLTVTGSEHDGDSLANTLLDYE